MQPILLELIKGQVELRQAAQPESILLNEIDFSLSAGESLVIVGESGSGKTLLLKTILRLLPPHFQVSGRLLWYEDAAEGNELFSLKEAELTYWRRTQVGFLPQAPQATLSPAHTCGKQIAEMVGIARQVQSRAAELIALELLQQVGFTEPQRIYRLYPHQLSGGMAQRVGLALALAGNPRLLLVDEPTAALDILARQEFYQLLRTLQSQAHLAVIMVTHDLEGLLPIADQMLVMLKGLGCESGARDALCSAPRHPYTQLLLETYRAVQRGECPQIRLPRQVIGESPSMGCPFTERCPRARTICRNILPPSCQIDARWSVRCHFPLS